VFINKGSLKRLQRDLRSTGARAEDCKLEVIPGSTAAWIT